MTGWNLPPGCNVNDLPGNQEEDHCMICGKHIDSCICPECPVCSMTGDPLCYEEHGLVRTQEQIDSFEEMERLSNMENDYECGEA